MKASRWNGKHLKPVGNGNTSQVVCGCIAVLSDVIAIICFARVDAPIIPTGFGIVTGVFFIAAGIVGLVASAKPTRMGSIVGFMVTSIIAAVFAGIMTLLTLYFGMVGTDPLHNFRYCRSSRDDTYRCTAVTTLVFLGRCIQVFIGLIELVASIWSSVLCCRKSSCCKANNPRVIYMTGSDMPLPTDGANIISG